MKVFAAALEAHASGQAIALVTVIGAGGSTPRSGGARMLVSTEGLLAGTIGGGAFEHRMIAAAQDALRTGRPARVAADLRTDLGMCCGGRMEVYIEPLMPKPRLWIFGAGHVAQAVARLMPELDFAVHVIDERPEWCTSDRFSRAELHAQDPLNFIEGHDGPPPTHVLITTHDHALDQALLEVFLQRELGWLGMIGSRAKVQRFFKRLQAAGTPPETFERVSSPVGLSIGAETPEEIAIAIAAELIAERRKAKPSAT